MSGVRLLSQALKNSCIPAYLTLQSSCIIIKTPSYSPDAKKHTVFVEPPLQVVYSIPYSRKIWHGIKLNLALSRSGSRLSIFNPPTLITGHNACFPMCTATDKRQIKISPILFMPNLWLFRQII